MSRVRPSVLLVILAAVGATSLSLPLRYQLSTRVEGHLLPAVSTGPLDPCWSPDGRWITFSMQGDIWKVPARGGQATALTAGPAYHFEPRWSPDGARLALSMDLEGNLDIGMVSAEGGRVERLTNHPGVDVQPAWSPDGESLFFVTGRSGNLDIYRFEFHDRSRTPVVSGPRHQIQPSVSPDGRSLAYVGPVAGRLGSGGIWIKSLSGGESRLIHFEETSYRAKPRWTPDGTALVYISDVAGSNDLAILPAGGGIPVRLTSHPMDEYDPDINPDGSRIAFVSNQEGPTTLFTLPTGGGSQSSWQAVGLSSFRPRRPSGRLHGRVVDSNGQPSSARIQLLASDGRAYAPRDGFHRVISATETHYFHTRGSFEVLMPAGEARLEAIRGFEYQPAQATVQVPVEGRAEVTLRLTRLADPVSEGWYSGDTHVHDLHQGRYGLTQQDMSDQVAAEDIRVTNALIHMDGTKLMGRWDDLTGQPHPLSSGDHILYYSQEFRGAFGHVGLLGLKHFITPLIGGVAGTAYSADVLNGHYLEQARRQGAIGGFLHPYSRRVSEPREGSGSEIPLNVALGQGDFFDVVCLASDELASAEMYYRFLNCGFRLPATGGSDNFSDMWRDPPPGSARTYARLDQPFSFESWISAVKAGRTFATNGPLLFLAVEGKGPGEELHLAGGDDRTIQVKIEIHSLAPLDRLELVLNGRVVHTLRVPRDRKRFMTSTAVSVPQSGWIAARVIGPGHRYIGDDYAFAQTSPVYLVDNGQPFTSVADARFLLETVQAFWKRVESRDRWRTAEQKRQFQAAVERAIAVYRKIATDH